MEDNGDNKEYKQALTLSRRSFLKLTMISAAALWLGSDNARGTSQENPVSEYTKKATYGSVILETDASVQQRKDLPIDQVIVNPEVFNAQAYLKVAVWQVQADALRISTENLIARLTKNYRSPREKYRLLHFKLNTLDTWDEYFYNRKMVLPKERIIYADAEHPTRIIFTQQPGFLIAPEYNFSFGYYVDRPHQLIVRIANPSSDSLILSEQVAIALRLVSFYDLSDVKTIQVGQEPLSSRSKLNQIRRWFITTVNGQTAPILRAETAN